MPSEFTRATAGSHEPAAAKAPPPVTTAGRAARPAVAGTLWGELVLGAGAVTPGVLAHEMAHVLQAERFGARGARGSVTTSEAPDEREAQELAPRILRGDRVEAMQAPTAALQLWTPTDAPALPHAEELRDATRESDADKVIDILASYHSAGQVAALRDAYGPGLVRDINRAFHAGRTKTLWSLARTYLGDNLTVAEKIFIDDAVFGLQAEQIMAEIHGLSDKQALRIVLSEEGLPSLQLDSSEDLGPKTTLSDVRAALADALDDRQLYEAMNLLFLKAGRANLGQWTTQGTWPVDEATPSGLITWTVPTAPGRLSLVWNEPEDFLEVPPSGPDVDLDLVGSPLLMDPVARHRIDLALEQVAAADETTDEGSFFKHSAPRLGRAMIAIGVLTATERRVLWARLATRSWVGFKQDQVERLHRLALYPDDALVLERAAIEADKERYGYEPEMAMAARAAQAMIDDARSEAAQTADPHRKSALEQRAGHATTVFGSLAFQSAIGAYPGTEGQLAGLGADELQIARQQLRRIDSVGALFALIESLPPARRRHAGFGWEVTMRAEEIGLDAGEQATLDAYMNFGSTPDDLNRIVLYQVKSAFADKDAARALGILHRLTPEQRAQFVAWAPYLEWYKKLIWAGDDGRSMYIYLTEVNEGRTQQALEKAAMFVSWMTPDAAPVIKDKNAYTELLNTRKERQPDRRRGFVLWSRLREDPKLELTDEERRLVDEYTEHRRLTDDFGRPERERVDEVYFGQPQLMTTAEREVDPTAEADYMFLRIAGRTKLKTTWKTVTDDVRAWRGEYLGPAVTEFLLTYGELRAAGIDKARLVILGDLYHRAMRETDEIERERDMASLVASIVGAVVAVAVVTVLSGGTMSGPAIAAVAALAGGAAAATAGALIRPESTGWEVLRDFGTGAVEGAMAVAGSALAARVVRLVGLGVEAGGAAANAVELSTGARAAAGVVNAVVDGAVGGAAGEVFRTATDEATWDRSISEALARVLGSIARGAAQGAAGGFVVSAGLAAGGGLFRIASRLGQSTAVRAADMLESSGMSLARFNELSEVGQDALVATERLAAQGDIDGALKLLGTVEALTADEVARVASTLRSVRVAEAVLETGLDRAEVLRRLEVVEPAEFARRTSNARGNAVLEFEKDGPRILMRADVDPLVVREEIVHLRQWLNDPMMRARMERVGALKPETWASLSTHERASLVIDKLEVEADAQSRIIANLEQRAAAGDVAAADQIAAAEDTMRLIGKRLDEVEEAVATGAVGRLDLETQPRLFSKEAPSRGADPTKAKNWSKVQSKGVLDKDPAEVEAKLRELGYTPVKNRSDGRIWKINRPSGGAKTDDFAFLQIVETEAGPRVVPGQQRLTFAERRNLAAQTFRRRTKDVALMQAELASGKLAPAQRKVLRDALEDASPEYLGELQRAVASGKLDEGSAGLLAPWGPMVQALKKRGRGYAELLGPVTGHQGPLTEGVYDEFRRALRQVAAEDLAAIPLPRARRAALDDMLDLQPDSKSKGELFSAYLRIGRTPAGERYVLDVPFESPLAPSRRQPDDVNFGSDLSEELPPGTFAVEHKAGPGAFKIDQAEGYARSFSAPGGPVTTTGAPADWDGVVYVFSTRSEAQTALGQMQRSATVRPLLDRPKNGIHLLYVDEAGFLRPFRAGGGVAP